MGTLTSNGGQPATVRVFEVTSTTFKVHINEWAYLDTIHANEVISYLVAEAGNWECTGDGHHYAAGKMLVKDEFVHVGYNEIFEDAVVFTQITSRQHSVPMTTRQ